MSQFEQPNVTSSVRAADIINRFPLDKERGLILPCDYVELEDFIRRACEAAWRDGRDSVKPQSRQGLDVDEFYREEEHSPGQRIADAVERYCDARERRTSDHVRDEMDAKAALAREIDEAFAPSTSIQGFGTVGQFLKSVNTDPR